MLNICPLGLHPQIPAFELRSSGWDLRTHLIFIIPGNANAGISTPLQEALSQKYVKGLLWDSLVKITQSMR